MASVFSRSFGAQDAHVKRVAHQIKIIKNNVFCSWHATTKAHHILHNSPKDVITAQSPQEALLLEARVDGGMTASFLWSPPHHIHSFPATTLSWRHQTIFQNREKKKQKRADALSNMHIFQMDYFTGFSLFPLINYIRFSS